MSSLNIKQGKYSARISRAASGALRAISKPSIVERIGTILTLPCEGFPLFVEGAGSSFG